MFQRFVDCFQILSSIALVGLKVIAFSPFIPSIYEQDRRHARGVLELDERIRCPTLKKGW